MAGVNNKEKEVQIYDSSYLFNIVVILVFKALLRFEMILTNTFGSRNRITIYLSFHSRHR